MSLYIKETGKSNNETIVFLHGEGIAGWVWDEQLKAFSDYHCIIPDLPGHGKSAEVKSFSVQSAADMIIDIIKNRAKNGKAHLVGLSLGAQIIVQILNTAPEVVNHALISGAIVRNFQPTESFLKLLDNLIALYLPDKDKTIRIMSYVRSYNIPKNLRSKFKESTYVIEPYSLDKILRETILFKMPDNLEHADVPVLVMTGEKDYRIINESALNLLNTLPNSKGAMALKVGHLWNIENPDLFNNVLRSWLKRY
ncbi:MULTISPECIES: alpha/beta fold hydrolase [Methanobacterium]|jgi:pimeloyl-ACP methyl ester carboxylesterase|uniref:Alpha/beta hydrolase n=1 Tax=Methanobacterium bryantii TaxID=2161 RepID=A0A2A2H6F5_METBR|nr:MULTISPECIES: alpha/beta hydrolase [Methanobacterium]OEC85836.1 alpha/beta hydrolase [Methanobacterium sp. A39]PAV05009.1 alpha/beta hydrolase [Methanobacterium bryantii]